MISFSDILQSRYAGFLYPVPNAKTQEKTMVADKLLQAESPIIPTASANMHLIKFHLVPRYFCKINASMGAKISAMLNPKKQIAREGKISLLLLFTNKNIGKNKSATFDIDTKNSDEFRVNLHFLIMVSTSIQGL